MEVIDDTVKSYYDETLGTVISSKKQRKKLMKERGLTFSADYSAHKPSKTPIKITRDDIQKAKMMVKYNKK